MKTLSSLTLWNVSTGDFVLFAHFWVLALVSAQQYISILTGNGKHVFRRGFSNRFFFVPFAQFKTLSLHSIMSRTRSSSCLLITCLYHSNLASFIFSTMSSTPHLLISSFQNFSDHISFISSYYMIISS